jgi:hypothetical protein
MKQIVYKITFFSILTFSTNVNLFCQSLDITLKAVAFEKLALFITWPQGTQLKDTSSTFVIAVLNNIPFGRNLEETYKTQRIKNKRVKIVYIKNVKKLKMCDLLYISNSSVNELKTILSAINGRPILTISDTEGFAEAGCFVNFYEYENKLRFEINQKGMKDAGFTIDYRLLRVSKVINPVVK